jgi:hypothetical protein
VTAAAPASFDSATANARLAAILAQHTAVKHVYLEMACGPEMAQAVLDRNFDNRPLREARARTMATDMAAGRFREKQPHPVCFDINGVLRDGQHRMRAIILSGSTPWLTFCFGCDPAERDYYDQGIARSVADIAREHGQQNATLASTTVALILRIEQETSKTFGRNEQTERLDELFQNDLTFVPAIHAGMKLRGMMSPAAAALAHWQIVNHSAHNEKVESFWEGIQKGANLPETSPTLRIRNELLARHRKGTGREGNIKKAAAIVLAWNAFIERRRPRHFEWTETLRLPEVR